MTEKNREKSYEYLIKEFGEDLLKDRFAFIMKASEQFISDRKIDAFVKIDTHAIKSLIIDYFADISRLKKFHEIERTNPIKVAAYTAYWTYKRKPLILSTSPADKDIITKPYLQDINEWFCTFLMLAMLYDFRYPLIGENIFYNKWLIFIENLNYFFIYRVVTPQSLELVLTSLDVNSVYQKLTPA